MTLPLKIHGGKHYLADWIIGQMGEHIHYVETHFGGGQVLFRKPYEGYSEVANDIDEELINFWVVIRTKESFYEFQRLIGLTPFSEDLFDSVERGRDLIKDFANSVDKAVAFFIRNRQSRQGLGKDFATLSKNRTRRGMNEQVSSWLGAIDGLPEAHERLKRVVILNSDALSIIKREDSPNTLFYSDPTYLHKDEDGTPIRSATSCYKHEMTLEDHVNLLEVLANIKGKFLLSGYRSKLYDRYCRKYHWQREEKEIDNKSSSKKVKDIKVECLWRNYL